MGGSRNYTSEGTMSGAGTVGPWQGEGAVLPETRRNDSLVKKQRRPGSPPPRRAPGTSKATSLARKYHGVHTEEASNLGSTTYLRDIGQPPDPI